MKTKNLPLLVLIASAMVQVLFVLVYSCNDPGPGLGVVQAFLGGDGGQEPRGQRRGTLRGVG